MSRKAFLYIFLILLIGACSQHGQDLNGRFLHFGRFSQKKANSFVKINSSEKTNSTKKKKKVFLNKSGFANQSGIVSTAEADLQIAGWDYKDLWGWGCNTTIELCEYNNSNVAIAAEHLSQVYLSRDHVISSSDIKVGEPVSFGPIRPEGFMWGSLCINVPSLDTGKYYIGCIVDIDDTVHESDENNSYNLGTIYVTGNLSDLIAAGLDISWGGSWAVGSDLTFIITEKNAGSRPAGEHYDQLCLFDIFNNTIPVADGIIHTTSPDETKRLEKTIKIPLIFNGDYNLGIFIDSDDNINECDEHNIYQIPDYIVTVTGGKPVLVSPLNGAVDQHSEIKLEWVSFQNPDARYLVQISDDPDFSRIIQNISGLSEPWVNINGLKNNTKYYWRIAAGPEIGDYTDWSDVWNFYVSEASPQSPILKYPANNSFYNLVNPELSWYEIPYVHKYHLQISADSSFTSLLINDSSIIAPKKNIGPLSFKKKYYWRLRAGNSAGYGNFSDAWCFTTRLEPIKAPTTLIAELKNKNVQLKWIDNSQNEVSFSIFRKTGDSLTYNYFELIGTAGKNITEFSDGNIISGNTYTYMVSAVSSDTVSAFSNQAEIRIITSVGKDIIPIKFQVDQNYPNPFNSSTAISFDLPELCHVKLSIYDLLGREIIVLINGIKYPGRYTIRFDAQNLTSGQYFYSLQAGERRALKKAVVLK